MNERLPPNQQLIEAPRWPVVGERQPAAERFEVSVSDWSVSIEGQIDRPLQFKLSELQQLPCVECTVDLHCVTRWSRYDMAFKGVLLETLLEMAQPKPAARFLSFVASSDRNHSTSLPLDEAVRLRSMLAWEANHSPLESLHGGPLRMVVPGKYFYKSVKWLKRIDVLSEDRLGYWEAETGYHNGADPWREERFLAPSLNKREAAKLIEARDFGERDLRSLSAADRDLERLKAARALLRNADFQRSNLAHADFREANLSNARLCRADLRFADFTDADLEGADFSEADLRGVDLRGASLFGTTFCGINQAQAARIDSSTKFERAQLEALTDLQRAYVEKASPSFEPRRS